jgi:hypothetical protein
MADDLIHCPSCGFQLRLPTELYGTAVECPQCHARFTAPAPTAQPAADRPPPGREYDANAPVVAPIDYAPPAGNPVAAPAVALLVVSLLGVISDLLGIGWAKLAKDNPQVFQQQLQRQLEADPNLTPQDRQQMEKMLSLENVTHFLNLDCGISLALNLVTALATVQMLRRRTYALAVLGCVLALNPANVPMCALQVPFGIWGLIVLLTENGRRAFR